MIKGKPAGVRDVPKFDGSMWTFPVARHQFEGVTSIDSDGASAKATFSWHWALSTVGSDLIAAPKRHENKAELARGPSSWTLTTLSLDSDLD